MSGQERRLLKRSRFGLLEAFLLFIAFLFLADTALQYAVSASTASKASRRVMDQTAAAIEHETAEIRESTELLLLRAESSAARKILDVSDFRSANAFFMGPMEATPYITSVNYGDSAGNGYLILFESGRWRNRITKGANGGIVTWVLLDNTGKVLSQENRKDDYDPRGRPWYRDAAGSPGIRWSRPYIFRTTRDVGITASLAIGPGKNGSPGVVGADVMLKDLSLFFSRLKRENSEVSINLVSPEGEILASSEVVDFLRILRKGSNELPRISDDGFQDLSAAYRSFEKAGRDFLSLSSSGKSFYAVRRPFPLTRDRQYYMVLTVPQQSLLSFYGSANKLRVFLYLVMVAASGFFFASRYLAPLRRLTRAVQTFGTDDYEPPSAGDRKDEVGVLVSEFCGMADDLTARQRELASLINNVPGMVYRGHRDWSISFIGAEVESVTGHAPHAFTSGAAKWKEVILPDDLERVKETFRKAITERMGTLCLEYRIRHKDGGIRWLEDRRQIIYGENGALANVDGLLLDITYRKHAEEALEAARRKTEEEKAKTEAIIAAIGEGISIQDRQFRIIYQNEVHKGFAGEQRGRYCYEAYAKKDRVCEVCPIVMAYRDGGVHTIEKRIENEGGIKFIEITASALKDGSGAIAAGIELVRDITERRRMEEDRTRLSMAVEQSAETIVITDREGTIRYVNPAFERITGYSREEAIGRNPRVLKSGKHDASFYKDVWSILGRGEVWTGHFINRKKDGSLFEEDATISPVRDSSGEIVNYVAVKRDVTGMVSLEKQLRTAQKMESVGTLAGGIAHDFNNALTGILGFGEMLKTRIAGDPKAISDLDEILRCAERASVLTRQLLTFARRQIIDPANLDLNEVVTGLVKLLRKVTRENIEIATFLEEGLPRVRADQGQIEQVLMNLSLNARDAMPDGGRLAVSTEEAVLDEEYVRRYPYMKTGRYAVLSVSDTGTGMDERTRERIFEPFFTTKGPDRGTGLGLAVVYGIVKQHNGFIHVYSEPGKGTTFRTYLPAVDAPADMKSLPSPGSIRGGSETILLAEDDESVRHLTARTLSSLGYRVLIACDGEEAVRVLREHGKEIAMVVLDVVMPRMGGKQAYDEMVETYPGMKALFLSGYSADAIHDAFVLHPGLPFLQKPFGSSSLARKVREVLDRV